MKEIKEKLLKEIENKVISYINRNNQLDYSKVIRRTIKETSKAIVEEELNWLDTILREVNTSLVVENLIHKRITEIKQKLEGGK